MKIEDVLDEIADITYMWGCHFFLETSLGNFIWQDPDYEGDNTISLFLGNYHQACAFLEIPYGRGKGQHVVRAYCGSKLTLGPDLTPTA